MVEKSCESSGRWRRSVPPRIRSSARAVRRFTGAQDTVVTFLHHLIVFNQLMYSDTLKFFFDIYGGHRIGAVWLLSVSGIRPFRALGRFSSMPATEVGSSMCAYIRMRFNILQGKSSKEKDKRDTVSLNRQSILDEIERLGTGLIKKITVRE